MPRTTLITGGSRGIGYALAEALLRNGDHVAFTGTSTDGVMRAEHALASAVGDPGRIAGIVCDVRDAASAERAVRTAAERFGGLDALVNNAGVGVGVPIADMPHDEWERIIGTTATSATAATAHPSERFGGVDAGSSKRRTGAGARGARSSCLIDVARASVSAEASDLDGQNLSQP